MIAIHTSHFTRSHPPLLPGTVPGKVQYIEMLRIIEKSDNEKSILAWVYGIYYATDFFPQSNDECKRLAKALKKEGLQYQ